MSKKNLILTAIFVALQVALLSLILTTKKPYSFYLEFTSVAMCFIFCFLFTNADKSMWLVRAGLLFTVISDFCLEILSPIQQAVAMTTFSVAQILYAIKLQLNIKSEKRGLVALILRAVIIALVEGITIVVLKDKVDYLALVSMFYYANIIFNLVLSFIEFKINPLFALGLVFFILCDTIIGLNVAIPTYITVPATSIIYKILNLNFNLAWFFYVPSQTLITLSILKKKKLC